MLTHACRRGRRTGARPFAGFLLAFVVALSLSGCDLMDSITQLIVGSKGSRAVNFLVLEPYKVRVDENKHIKSTVGFDAETAGLENTLSNAVNTAAAGRPWTVSWYDHSSLSEFYDQASLHSRDIRDYLRNELTTVQRISGYGNCETLICMFIEASPEVIDNDTFLKVYAYGYDSKENTFVIIPRTIPRDQSSYRFKEQLAKLTQNLCEKLYSRN